MKKVITIILAVFILIAGGLCLLNTKKPYNFKVTDEMWAEMEENSKVNIKKTFKGDIDDVIDDYIIYHDGDYEDKDGYDDPDDTFSELPVAVHKTFDTEKNGDEITCYIAYDYLELGFENGIFTISGDGGLDIASVITLKKVKNKENTYKVIKHIYGYEGHLLEPSLERMFSKDILKEYNNNAYENELEKETDKKARDYLNQIGRDAEFKANVDKEYLTDGYFYEDENGISQEEADEIYDLFDEFEEKDYPDWIGSREQVKNNKRYIYKASSVKKGDMKYIITYTKENERGKILEQYKMTLNGKDYKIKKVV